MVKKIFYLHLALLGFWVLIFLFQFTQRNYFYHISANLGASEVQVSGEGQDRPYQNPILVLGIAMLLTSLLFTGMGQKNRDGRFLIKRGLFDFSVLFIIWTSLARVLFSGILAVGKVLSVDLSELPRLLIKVLIFSFPILCSVIASYAAFKCIEKMRARMGWTTN